MALEMRATGKAVRFEYHDDEASTVVVLSPDEDQEVLVRKLRRVIALVEGVPRITYPTDVREFLGPQKAVGRALERPEIPEHLKGEVELEEPQAPGNGWAAQGAGE